MISEGMARSSEDVKDEFDAGDRASVPILEAHMSYDSALEGTGSIPSHLKRVGEGSNSLHGVSWSSAIWTQEAVRRQESAPLAPALVDDDNLTGGAAEKQETVDDGGQAVRLT